MRSDYIKLFLDFSALPRTVRNPSIFEVAGFPHYENVISNILKFYLDPQREHGMGSLLLDSVLTLAGKEAVKHTTDIEIAREHPTIGGGRLDLLITTSDYVIGIENKIFAIVYNDLPDYWTTVKARAQGHLPIGIVLSLRKTLLPDNCGFKNITYAHLWSAVKSQLGHRIQKGDSKWLQYLFDLMDTTKNLEGAKIDLTDEDKFFIEHDAVVKRLIEGRNNFLLKLHSRVRVLQGMIEESNLMPFEKQWIYDKTCLVHEFVIDGHNISFDLSISPTDGWELQIFERHSKTQEYLEPLLKGRACQVVADEDNYSEKRFIIEKWPLVTQLEDIKDKLCDWLQWLPKQVLTIKMS